MFEDLNTAQLIAITVLPLLFAITLHEAAHGWVAMKLGDNTAKMLGRITLNPVPHIDPVGTIAVPLILVLLSSLLGNFMIFGWAKPVPITWRHLRNPRRDIALVALAGPMANLLMAIFWFAVLKITFGPTTGFTATSFILMSAALGIYFNLLLMILNLLPILPLDGGRVLNSLLPYKLSRKYSELEPYGLFILLALMAVGLLPYLLAPAPWLYNLFIQFV
ncbi:site-2 protease family protein [Candidatus Venteria ishoeyi]|uniref:Peptidase family M50 n=1 Tax=Candidatus Venteria ishoeyi TaxID=1899563 RepID=A0A1H6F8K5_9GAMM|nr:site-2 protease family protein [Candidatus Venteria ishoeyi]MDM8546076.1 site-2 protease family protein [Candidatus Venteria ishoeyi]SEH05731.1 Peptidase family M50 [Candidatus Venteria ishoeyi]